ncbi:hypothetical protein [Pedobacter sp.]|jgi:hypothetical protein|uniref:hypothetical protein n=1 Tax=Pedobacter sp. TaxID=1411316 RepID=UPI002BF7FD95|nr:hypothetical protein [Pedobacter sp.]HWW42739.1 hypothetical protein [Pedobacter sp.]
MTFKEKHSYRIYWIILILGLLVMRSLNISKIVVEFYSLLPLLLVTYMVKVEKFDFYDKNRIYEKNTIFNILMAGISFFLFFFTLNDLFAFVGEPYRRIILVFSLVNYYYLVRALLGKPKLNKAQ